MVIKLRSYRGSPIVVNNGDSIDAQNSVFSVINIGVLPCHVRYVNCDVSGRMDTRSHTVINNYNTNSNNGIICHIFIQPESSEHQHKEIERGAGVRLKKF